MTSPCTPAISDRLAAIYLRISYKNRNAVLRQKEDLIALCVRFGWEYRIYIDYDQSGWTENPDKEFYNLLDDLKNGLIHTVLMWQTDRLTRQGMETEEFLRIAQDQGVSTMNLAGTMRNMTDPNDRYNHRNEASAAILESDKISLRTRRAAKQNAEQGRAHWPCRPFGYTMPVRNGVGVETVAHEAALIESAYHGVLAGRSMKEIAREWNAAGVTTPTRDIRDPDDPENPDAIITVNGLPWNGAKIRALLLNPRNAGLREHQVTKKVGKKRVIAERNIVGQAQWPSIIDEGIYRGVVAKLTASTKHPNAWVRQHLLSGLARCGYCGSGLTVHVPTVKNAAYHCASCLKIRRDKDKVDDLVITTLFELLADQQAIRDRFENGVDVEKLRARLIELDGVQLELGKALRAGLAFDVVQAQIDDVTTERKQISATLDCQPHRIAPLERLLTSEDMPATWLEMPLDEQRAAIDLMMTITVHGAACAEAHGHGAQKGGRAPFDPTLVEVTPLV